MTPPPPPPHPAAAPSPRADAQNSTTLPVVETPECIRCGFCLPACPTYEVLGTEMDSPRGRLALMRGLDEGRIAPTDELVRHLDLCLGCRACETDCPSGVPYGAKLEEARSHLFENRSRPLRERLIQAAVLRGVTLPPFVQAAGMALARGVSRIVLSFGGPIGARLVNASPLRLLAFGSRGQGKIPDFTPGSDRPQPAPRVAVFTGCIARSLFGGVNEATVELLVRTGCDVVVPRDQGCCGALHAHAGDREGARELARQVIAVFERAGEETSGSEAGPFEAIAVNAAGCGAQMKEYASLLADDPEWASRAERFSDRVKDAMVALAERGLADVISSCAVPETPAAPIRVAYHDACHLAHAQGIRIQPRELLAVLPGVELVPLADADRCCGSAGIYNLLHPQVADQILAPKLARLAGSKADVVAAGNPGCLLQIASGASSCGMTVQVIHPLELIAQRIGGRSGRRKRA